MTHIQPYLPDSQMMMGYGHVTGWMSKEAFSEHQMGPHNVMFFPGNMI